MDFPTTNPGELGMGLSLIREVIVLARSEMEKAHRPAIGIAQLRPSRPR